MDDPFPEESIHRTTMSPSQRSGLIRILRAFWPIEQLAKLNDRQLHEQWLADCQYIESQRAPLGIPNDDEQTRLQTVRKLDI